VFQEGSDPVGDAIGAITEGGVVDDSGRVTNIDKTGGSESATEALDRLAGALGTRPGPSKDRKASVVRLPGGGTAAARPGSKTGPPTIQVDRPGVKTIKIRFPRF